MNLGFSVMVEVIFLSLVFLMLMMNHPLTLGFTILIISSLSSVILCKFVISWFGYSLFLVYVGGILVMFSYVVSLSPNLTKFSFNYFYMFAVLLIINSVLIYQLDLGTFWQMKSFVLENGLNSLSMVGGLYNDENVIVMLFLLIMLLVTMVMVVKICYYRSGPLRPFN